MLPSQSVSNGPIESENEDIQKTFKSASRLVNTVGIKNLLANRIPKLKQFGIILCHQVVACNQVFFQNYFENLFKLSNLIPLLIIDIKRYLHDQSVLFTVSGDINF